MSKDNPPLLPCPFCGGTNLELCNTHSPSFWVECLDCRAEVHGGAVGKGASKIFSYSENPEGPHEADYAGLPKNYRKAADKAIAAWNRRASGKTECRPAGAVPAAVMQHNEQIRQLEVQFVCDAYDKGIDQWDAGYANPYVPCSNASIAYEQGKVRGKELAEARAGAVPADAYTYEDGWLWRNGKNVAKCNDEEGARIVAALRGRVVGGAAPGEREAFEAVLPELHRENSEGDWTYPAHANEMMRRAFVAGVRWRAAGDLETAINHETDPHCCGCYNVSRDLIARCNECGHTVDLKAALTSAAPPPPVKCKGRSGVEPSDCDFPHCDCDPVVERVKEALLEEGWHPPQRRAAPPPVVPQVELLRRLIAETALNRRDVDEDADGFELLWKLYRRLWNGVVDAIAALGAADLQAVGRAQGQHDATTRASRSTEVPSTEEKP